MHLLQLMYDNMVLKFDVFRHYSKVKLLDVSPWGTWLPRRPTCRVSPCHARAFANSAPSSCSGASPCSCGRLRRSDGGAGDNGCVFGDEFMFLDVFFCFGREPVIQLLGF